MTTDRPSCVPDAIDAALAPLREPLPTSPDTPAARDGAPFRAFIDPAKLRGWQLGSLLDEQLLKPEPPARCPRCGSSDLLTARGDPDLICRGCGRWGVPGDPTIEQRSVLELLGQGDTLTPWPGQTAESALRLLLAHARRADLLLRLGQTEAAIDALAPLEDDDLRAALRLRIETELGDEAIGWGGIDQAFGGSAADPCLARTDPGMACHLLYASAGYVYHDLAAHLEPMPASCSPVATPIICGPAMLLALPTPLAALRFVAEQAAEALDLVLDEATAARCFRPLHLIVLCLPQLRALARLDLEVEALCDALHSLFAPDSPYQPHERTPDLVAYEAFALAGAMAAWWCSRPDRCLLAGGR